jgi:hypothetical protein
MRKLSILTVSLFMIVFVNCDAAHATPMNYFFQGVITTPFAPDGWNGPGSTEKDYRDLYTGQVISFTYQMDLDIISQPDGLVHDVLLVSHSDTFFIDNSSPGADDVVSTATSPLAGSIYYDSFIRSDNEFNYTKFGYPNGTVCGGGTDYIWEIGDVFYGYSYQRNNEPIGLFGYEFNAQLVSVSPVPEPSSVLLMFTGLAVMAGFGFNRKYRVH